MANKFHKNLIEDDIHVIPARTYDTLTERDDDIPFHSNIANVNKVVRVDDVTIPPATPEAGYFILVATDPIWLEFTHSEFDEFIELIDTPLVYAGQKRKVLFVNEAEDGVEFANQLFFDPLLNRLGIGISTPPATLSVQGEGFFQNLVNSTTAFQVVNTFSSPVFNVDTFNLRVGIETATPAATLDVNGSLIVDTDTLFVDAPANKVGINELTPTAALHINGPAITALAGDALVLDSNFGDGVYINIGAQGAIGLDILGGVFMGFNSFYDTDLNINARLNAAPVGFVQFNSLGGILFATAPTGAAGSSIVANAVFSITNPGEVTFQNAIDTNDAFRILDADGGDPIFIVDSVNEHVGIRTIFPLRDLDVNGDLLVRAAFVDASFSNGTPGQVLTSTGTATSWLEPIGDVKGPDGAANNAITRFDGNTGKLIQNSITFLDDLGGITIPIGGGLSVDGATFNVDVATRFVKIGQAGSPLAKLHVNTLSPANIGFMIQGSPIQVADLMQITNDIGGLLLRFTEAGDLIVDTTTLVVDSANNRVGIGTALPSESLHVAGNLRVTGAFFDSLNSPGLNEQILRSTATGTAWSLVTVSSVGDLTVPDGADLIVGTDKLIVDANTGNVRISVPIPQNSVRLQVSSNDILRVALLVQGANGQNSDVFQITDHLLNQFLKVTASGTLVVDTDTLFVDSGLQRVGIGTATPSQKLHIVGAMRLTGALFDSTNSPGTIGQILSSTVTGTDWITGVGDVVGPITATLNAVARYADGTGKKIKDSLLTVDDTGVAILTHATGGSTLRINSTAVNAATYVHLTNIAGAVALFGCDGNGFTGPTRVNDASIGNFNVAAGDLNFFTAATFRGRFLFNGDFEVDTNTLYVDASLNRVGIGITVPTQLLHVAGSMRLQDQFYDGNNLPGLAGQILSSTATTTEWVDETSSGDVFGPALSVDTSVARFNGTNNKTIEDSNLTISDGGNMNLTAPNGTAVFATFSTTVNNSNYAIFTNEAGTRAIFGCDGGGLSSISRVNDATMANFNPTAGGLNFLTNALLRGRFLFNGDLEVDTDTFYVETLNARVGVGTITPNSKLQVLGSFAVDRLPITVSSVSVDEMIIAITAIPGGGLTVTMQTIDLVVGRLFIIKDESGNASNPNPITIATQGGQTIDGVASVNITVAYGVMRLYSNGTNLFSW